MPSNLALTKVLERPSRRHKAWRVMLVDMSLSCYLLRDSGFRASGAERSIVESKGRGESGEWRGEVIYKLLLYIRWHCIPLGGGINVWWILPLDWSYWSAVRHAKPSCESRMQ